jgi:hypothetical protein
MLRLSNGPTAPALSQVEVGVRDNQGEVRVCEKSCEAFGRPAEPHPYLNLCPADLEHRGISSFLAKIMSRWTCRAAPNGAAGDPRPCSSARSRPPLPRLDIPAICRGNAGSPQQVFRLQLGRFPHDDCINFFAECGIR